MAGEMCQLAQTALGAAILEGDPWRVRELIAGGEDHLYQDRKGNTYLHYVCTMYRPYVINVLLAKGVSINAQNKHGNTALHVSALQRECCHVVDLMQCGIDPNIANSDGKLASDIATGNKYWLELYAKYEPTLRLAIQSRDLDKVRDLFRCWSAVHLVISGRDMRQFAASLTFHDIVAEIDRVRFSLMAVFAIKECDVKTLKYAISRGSEICDVNFLETAEGCHPHHMLQHTIRQRSLQMVTMVLEAGADVNTKVYIQEYVRGPLFFEIIRQGSNLDLDITRCVLNADIDVTARDERGRSALIYCLDQRGRRSDDVTLEVVELLLKKGIDIAMRDDTGCTARDVALLSRRYDVVSTIDKSIIQKVKSGDVTEVLRLVVAGYEDIIIECQHRDTWIYAAGNETTDMTSYLEGVAKLQESGKTFQGLVRRGCLREVKAMYGEEQDKAFLLHYRDKSGRRALLTALLYGQLPVARWLLETDGTLATHDLDNCERGPLHYTSALPGNGDSCSLLHDLQAKGLSPDAEDVLGIKPDIFAKRNPSFISDQKQKRYGLEVELHNLKKYEALLSVIRSRNRKLKHFDHVLKSVTYPVADFYKLFHPGGRPLVSRYRDLLLCAVDHAKEDIAHRLLGLRVDCSVTAEYTDAALDGLPVRMDAVQRARFRGLSHIADDIQRNGFFSGKILS